ncbi:unnamed protein product, partial [Closterium sp. Naga37s-1]
ERLESVRAGGKLQKDTHPSSTAAGNVAKGPLGGEAKDVVHAQPGAEGRDTEALDGPAARGKRRARRHKRGEHKEMLRAEHERRASIPVLGPHMAKGGTRTDRTVADDKMPGSELGDGEQQGERPPAADSQREDDSVVQTMSQGPTELVGHMGTDRNAERAAGLKKYDEDRKRLEEEEQREQAEFERRKREREAKRRACDEQLASLQAANEARIAPYPSWPLCRPSRPL